MEEWKEYKLGEVAVFSQGIQVGIEKQIETCKEGYVRFIRIVDYTKGIDAPRYILYPGARYIVDETDIVMMRYGTPGKVARGYSGAIANNMFKITVNEDFLNKDYTFYYLSQDSVYRTLVASNSSSTMPAINFKIIEGLDISAPSISEQIRIVKLLKSLDDKIEVNRKINENLEQQAQALFKSWFVDFEPFKNVEFVESELGMIPKGWRVGKLGELCQFKRGKGLLSKNAISGDVPVVAGGLEPACYHNTSNTKAPVITVSGSGANAGFMRMYHQEVWASDCSFIDITCENWLFVYCFLAINSHLLKHAQTGAVQPHVKPADIHDFDLAIPPKEYIQRFQDKISSFITKKGLIEQESCRLAELRDTLLPKLMSGELKVNEINII